MPAVHINYLAVLAAAVVNMGVGALWYSPALFAKQWMAATGKKMENAEGAGKGYFVTAIGALIQAFILAHFVQYAGATTFVDGLVTGLWVWLGFVATTHAANYVFEGKPLKLYKINQGYFLVVLAINAGLLAVWR